MSTNSAHADAKAQILFSNKFLVSISISYIMLSKKCYVLNGSLLYIVL